MLNLSGAELSAVNLNFVSVATRAETFKSKTALKSWIC